MTGGGAALRPNGLVTLLTDFGVQDTYVGQMKGVLFARSAELRAVIDLTHQVPAQNTALAGFLLEHAAQAFAPGTLHVAVVDPGVGSPRDILLAQIGQQGVLAPDNGLLFPWMKRAAESGELAVHALDPARITGGGGSHTFHGRDRFAPAAAAWLGGARLEEFGPRRSLDDLCSGAAPSTARALAEGGFEARILFVDHFGNLITDLAADRLGPDPAAFELHHADLRLPLRRTYSEVDSGLPVALVNSFDLVELGLRNGNAQEATGLQPGDPLRILPGTP